jgi:hypothetical protein
MTPRPSQFVGGALPNTGSKGGVSADRLDSLPGARKNAMRGALGDDLGFPRVLGHAKSLGFGLSTMANCVGESRV